MCSRTFHMLFLVLYASCSSTVLAQSTVAATGREFSLETKETRLPRWSDVDVLKKQVAEINDRLQNIAEQLDITRAECRSKFSDKSARKQEQNWAHKFNELTTVVNVVRSTVEAAVPSLDEQLEQLTTTVEELSANHSLHHELTIGRLFQLESTVDRMSSERVAADDRLDEKIRETSAMCGRSIDSVAVTLNASLEVTQQQCSNTTNDYRETTTSLNEKIADLASSVQQHELVFAESQAAQSVSFNRSLAEVSVRLSENQTALARVVGLLSTDYIALRMKIDNSTAHLESLVGELLHAFGILNRTHLREASHWNSRFEGLHNEANSSADRLRSAIFMTNESCSRSVDRTAIGIETLSASLVQKESSLIERIQQLTTGLQSLATRTSSLSTSLVMTEANLTTGLRQFSATLNSLTSNVERVEARCTAYYNNLTTSVNAVSTSLDQKDAAWNNRFQGLSTSGSAISATLDQKEAAINTRLQQLANSINGVTSSLTQKEAQLSARIQQLTSSLQAVQSQTGTLSTRSIKRCRVCFREIEGSSQCQQNRNSCSGWSDAATWTLPFRDDTDRRGGGCTYQWMVECQA